MSTQAEERPVVGGVHKHYKGGHYTVTGFAFHHQTRDELVLYRSHEKGWVNARPLMATAADPDGWAHRSPMPQAKRSRASCVCIMCQLSDNSGTADCHPTP
jgi:hypothetical protein